MSKKVYIFGAGSSVHANGPLNKHWIQRIKENEENATKNKAAIYFLNTLQSFDNIEVLLSLIDLSIIEQHNYLPISASLDYLENVREKIIDCIVNVAREINTNDPLLKDFFEKTKLQDGDTVINFNYDLVRLNNLMQHFGILRRKLKEGIRYNESKELQEIVIERKRRNQSVIGARDIFQEYCRIA